ncbi:MAG: hypothetical protein NWE76_01560, partial [Candidatus Bathyarchaeota archaeon]|nr:hypothetical protein [Candidatus Bathyarchaeota archaeon]
VIAIAVVLLSFVVAERFLAWRRKKPPKPGCSVEQVWSEFTSGKGLATDHERKAVERYEEELSPGDITNLKERLIRVEEESLKQAQPLVRIRRVIMDATDRFLLWDAHLGDSSQSVSTDYLLGVLEAGVLRRYAGQKYGDVSENDWYSHYLSVARMNAKNVVDMVNKSTSGESIALEASLHDPLTESMSTAREALLHYPVKTPVLEGDQVGFVASKPIELASDQQIEQLAEIIKVRFGKLYQGQLYGGVARIGLNPGGAFKLETGLLHILLSLRYPHDSKAWRAILEKALGKDHGALHDSEALVSLGKDLQKIWRESSDPLLGVLESGTAMLSAGTASGMNSDEGSFRVVAQQMRPDAVDLVRQFKGVVGEFSLERKS